MTPSAAPREISVDEAMALAIQCLQEGRIDDAKTICGRVLEVSPDYPDALHYAGMAAYKQGEVDQAIALVRHSLKRQPDQPDWHSNLGIMLQAQDDFEGAMKEFQRAIELRPGHAKAHNNLGVLLRLFGRNEEAEAAYRTAIVLEPNYADAYHNLAILLDLMGRTHDAAMAFFKELTLRPEDPNAWRRLALAYCLLGERDKAVTVCDEWLARYPGDPHALHTLAACSGSNVPPRASDAYVQVIFDSFAESFEAKLEKLHYRAPGLVAAAVAGAGIVPDGKLDVLDLGCGTGLCGPLLAPYARRIVGVDLSEGMLKHASDKHVYDQLVQGELTVYLRQLREAVDLIVSADTLVYFGDLEEVVAAAASALRPAGVFIFTVEEAVDSRVTTPFCIQPHGRYNHRAEYVERLLVDAGLQPVVERAELRMEYGLPVAGLVVRGRKPEVWAIADADAGRARLMGAQHG